MSASDPNALLQEAIALAQSGQMIEARARLEAIVAADPTQELAWLWLATVAADRDERIAFLERALALNPGNTTALEAYDRLAGHPYTPPAAPPRPRTASRLRTHPLIIIGAVALVATAILLLAIELRGGLSGSDPTPTLYIPPTEPATPTSIYSPTPSDTPPPTLTPGPSPTPVWMAPPATWTSVPSETPPPTRTPLPTWTPRPSFTPTLATLPYTPTFTPVSDSTPAEPAAATEAALSATPGT